MRAEFTPLVPTVPVRVVARPRIAEPNAPTCGVCDEPVVAPTPCDRCGRFVCERHVLAGLCDPCAEGE